MIAMAHFAGLVITTIFAAAAAGSSGLVVPASDVSPDAPAGAKKAQTFRSELVHGTREMARRLTRRPQAVRDGTDGNVRLTRARQNPCGGRCATLERKGNGHIRSQSGRRESASTAALSRSRSA